MRLSSSPGMLARLVILCLMTTALVYQSSNSGAQSGTQCETCDENYYLCHIECDGNNQCVQTCQNIHSSCSSGCVYGSSTDCNSRCTSQFHNCNTACDAAYNTCYAGCNGDSQCINNCSTERYQCWSWCQASDYDCRGPCFP